LEVIKNSAYFASAFENKGSYAKAGQVGDTASLSILKQRKKSYFEWKDLRRFFFCATFNKELSDSSEKRE